jgi:thiol-disulfide isomerase/thioredoxin
MKRMKFTPAVLALLLVTACSSAPTEADKAVEQMQENTNAIEDQMQQILEEVEADIDLMDKDMDGSGTSLEMDDMDTMNDMNSSDSSEEAMVDTEVVYSLYSEGVLTNGETKVIFFHAEWCPNCRENDTNLVTWYNEANTYSRSVYRVDYDTATALKAQFGVTSQDTFVVVDGDGTVVDGPYTFPTEEQLKALLS